jgi:hypothetical protein
MDTWQALLIFLFKDGRSWVNKLKRDDWRKVIASKPMFQDPYLLIAQDEGDARHCVSTSNEKGKGFVIAPGKHDPDTLVLLVPFLSMDGTAPKLSLQVGILRQEDGQRRFFGYRFESPEGFEEHNFYHAQPIQGFWQGKKCSHAITWYPYRYPTFPLKARNTFDLVASVILACRDSRHMKELASSQSLNSGVKGSLIDFLEHIKPMPPAPA